MSQFKKLSDEKLVEKIRNLDRELFAEIIHRYQTKLLRYAGYLMGDDDMAADAVQEAFIKAYINLNGFDTQKKFSSWLYRIVHNQAINQLKKQHKIKPMDDKFEYDSGVNLEDDFIKQELTNQTQACMEQMPILYREPLSLYFLEDKSYEEISDIVRIPIGTVGTRISRAKGMLKKICQRNQ